MGAAGRGGARLSKTRPVRGRPETGRGVCVSRLHSVFWGCTKSSFFVQTGPHPERRRPRTGDS